MPTSVTLTRRELIMIISQLDKLENSIGGELMANNAIKSLLNLFENVQQFEIRPKDKE